MDSPIEREEFIRLHQVIKGYAIHEDGLINSRLNWSLVINTFLFTGLAIATQQYPILSKTVVLKFSNFGFHIYFALAFLFSVLGSLSALFCLAGVRAALTALRELERRWGTIERHINDASILKNLPPMLGAGNQSAHDIGLRYPLQISLLLIICWVAVFLFNLTTLVVSNWSVAGGLPWP